MTSKAETVEEPRVPLSKDRVLQGAIEVADEGGIEALTMRRLAEHLGVEAMSLYYHVANKEALFDGVVESLMHEFAQAAGGFEIPEEVPDWKAVVRDKFLTARTVMLRHPWAPGVFETRSQMSVSTLMYFEWLLGVMRKGGFSYDLAHHAMHAVGSMSLGFVQEMFKPGSPQEEQQSEEMFEHMMEQLPYMAGMMQDISHDDPDTTLGWCDDQTEFEFTLDLLLDGLEQKRILQSA